MGLGTELASELAPEHASLIDNFKEQLLIAMVIKAGGTTELHVDDIDKTGGYVLNLVLDPETSIFKFTATKKS